MNFVESETSQNDWFHLNCKNNSWSPMRSWCLSPGLFLSSFLTCIFSLHGLSVVLHKRPMWDLEAGAAEASAVDTFLSGPKEVDIFPVKVCRSSRHGEQVKAELLSATAAGFWQTLPEKFRTLGNCSTSKTTRVISVTHIYCYILNIIHAHEWEQ